MGREQAVSGTARRVLGVSWVETWSQSPQGTAVPTLVSSCCRAALSPSLNPSQQTCHPTDCAAALLVPVPLRPHFPLQIPLLRHSDNVALIAPGEESQTNSTAYLQHQLNPEQKNPSLRLSPVKRFIIQIKQPFNQS